MTIENILISEHGEAKIGDFGLAIPIDPNRLPQEGEYRGTLHYAAPELCRSQVMSSRQDVIDLLSITQSIRMLTIIPPQKFIGPELDCWALGCLLYALVSKKLAFSGGDSKYMATPSLNTDAVRVAS